MNRIITQRICMEPKHMDGNLNKHILNQLSNTKNECSREHGFIMNIIKINRIIDNFISPSNSNIIFTVEFEASVLKPELGSIMQGNVCLILSTGILIDIQGKLKILIASNCLGEYKLDKTKSFYIHNNKEIRKGSILKVKIKGVRYCKHNFSCFGELVE